MDAGTIELLKACAGALCGGFAAYVAIRADLADLKARIKIAEKTSDHAHRRIDDILHGESR